MMAELSRREFAALGPLQPLRRSRHIGVAWKADSVAGSLRATLFVPPTHSKVSGREP